MGWDQILGYHIFTVLLTPGHISRSMALNSGEVRSAIFGSHVLSSFKVKSYSLSGLLGTCVAGRLLLVITENDKCYNVNAYNFEKPLKLHYNSYIYAIKMCN